VKWLEILMLPTIPSRYAQVEYFLTQIERAALLDYVVTQEPYFEPTMALGGELDYRRSKVLYSLSHFDTLIGDRIQAGLLKVIRYLRMKLFLVDQIELQLATHCDGDYYKLHNDNDSPETATRELTLCLLFPP
jgi:SM-20-related protein